MQGYYLIYYIRLEVRIMLNHSDDREIKSLELSDGLISEGIPFIVSLIDWELVARGIGDSVQ